ncbi:OmpA family protein [uncultured Megasphaera sp.]|uniref:OmpA family protein n=1 Tax=uncultured Megasphaera sp. TaxID=165188 RepID=UPI0025D7C38A|nr:OmpA family protein [uncultured Megasphaera sp.]
MMKKKSLVLAAVMAACATSFAFATPQTQWNQGQWQLDLGAWNPKAEVDTSNFDDNQGNISTDSKWNFQGGLGYGLSDKWGLQYNYYGLKTGSNDKMEGTNGDEHEVNLVYSINKNFAAFAGWNRIKNSFKDSNYSQTNNIAQIGLIAKAPLAKNLDFYAKGALGTKKTALWEAGLGYSITPDLDISAGYRYVNTKLADKGDMVDEALATDDANISYKGFIAGLSYRFGGGHKEAAPAPEPVYTPEPTPAPVVEAPVQKNDYYVESVHFGFDEDQPLPSERAKMDHFVQVAKANPNDTFKLVGNTDAKGSNAYNDDLSKRRVDNVAAYAESQGIPASQMQLDYKGKTDPVSTNDTEQGRADNRRVDIWQNH